MSIAKFGSSSFFGKSPKNKTPRGTKAQSYRLLADTPKETTTIPNQLTQPDLGLVPGICLVICDPQVDFHKGGKMPVPNADKISQKIARMISTFGDAIDEIFVTVQHRPSYHIGHPTFWQDNTGKPPESFVHIDKSDIEKKNYLSRHRQHAKWTIKYMESIQKARFSSSSLIVFPEHCLAGSKGAAVVDSVSSALRLWENSRGKCVRYITKGGCSRTEQYSVFQPVIQVKDDESTRFNGQLLNALCKNKRVIICGHLLSHSVKYSVLDFINNFPKKAQTSLIVIQDLCSTLKDFRNGSIHFLETLKQDHANDTRVVLSNESKLTEIFSPSFAETEFLQTEVQLYKRALTTYYSTSSFAKGKINNEEFFDFNQNGTKLMGDGCYMVYDDRHFGSLRALWHKAQENIDPLVLHQLRSCLGFFKPGFGARIPEFKFSNDPDGVLELARNLEKEENDTTKILFQGILKFVHECSKYNGTFILKASDDNEDSFLDAGLFGLDANNNVISIDTEHFVDPSSFTIISCIPKSANAYKGIAKQSVTDFIETGETLGATIQLTS